jgi:polyhydroxyalkanoate synthesis regulator phasin
MEEDDGEMDAEEIAVAAYNKADALIDLLVKKKIITREEIEKAEDELIEELEKQSPDQ